MHRILKGVSVGLNTTISAQSDSSTDFIDRADYIQNVWSVSTSGVWSQVRTNTTTAISVALRVADRSSGRRMNLREVTDPDELVILHGRGDDFTHTRIPLETNAYGGEVLLGYTGSARFVQVHFYFTTQNHITASVMNVVSLQTPRLFGIKDPVEITTIL